MNTKFATLLAIFVVAGCADSAVPVDPDTSTVALADGAADSFEQLRVRSNGMTVWAEPQVRADRDWLVQARTSHSLADISAVVGQEAAEATRISARKFEVRLSARQMEQNLIGEPLLVHVTTTSGNEFDIMFAARARFLNTSGSSKIYPWKNIEPMMVGRKHAFRGRVTTPEDVVYVAGWNDDDSEPIATQEDDTHWTLDWYPGMLAWAAHPTEDVVNLVADTADGTRYRRSAPIYMQLAQLGVTNDAPETAWPPTACTDAVRSCLADFDVETDVLEACGSAAEVKPCLEEIPVDDTAEWAQRFAQDFRRHLIAYYAAHGTDIEASGGNSRPQALLSVDSAEIYEVDDPNDVPSGHDLDAHRVFVHPDVTFPGSDILWFGVYDRATGAVVEIYDFN